MGTANTMINAELVLQAHFKVLTELYTDAISNGKLTDKMQEPQSNKNDFFLFFFFLSFFEDEIFVHYELIKNSTSSGNEVSLVSLLHSQI